MKPWKRIEPTIVAKVGRRTIVTKTFAMPDGSTADFQTYDVEGRQYVAVIALTPDNQIILSRQFRAGPEKLMNELPGGGVEEGESLEQAVARELLEETCYQVGNLEYLGFVHKDEKFNAIHHYFIASDCTLTHTSQKLDKDEHIEVVLVSIPELLEIARTGRLTDIGGVFLAYDQLLANRR